MKVFFYIPTLRPGGAEKQCALIAAEMKRRYGYESTVILNWGDGAKPEFVQCLRDADVNIVVLPGNLIGRLSALYSIFRANRDAVLFNYLTYPDFVGALIARFAGLSRIIGGIETDRMFGVKFIAEKMSHRWFSKKTICNSHKAYEFFTARKFDKTRMVIMPSAVTPKDMVARDGISAGDRREKSCINIVCVGRFVPAKNYAMWVDVINDVCHKRGNVRSCIVGYGELEDDIRRHIMECGLDDNISILPGKSTDVGAILKTADIYLSTSIREGTSNTILEAMAASLPVVATDVGDNSIMIENGSSGYIRETDDVAGLAEALLTLIDNPNLRNKFGMRAREIVMSKYSLEKISADYGNLIRSLQ